jgi:hypothetical protein
LTVTLVQRHSVRATYVGSCQDHRDGGPTSAHGSGPSRLCFDLVRTHDTKGIVCPEVAAQCCPTEGIRVLWVFKIVGQERTRTSRELDWETKHEDQSHPTRRTKQQMAVTVISRTAQAWTQNRRRPVRGLQCHHRMELRGRQRGPSLIRSTEIIIRTRSYIKATVPTALGTGS